MIIIGLTGSVGMGKSTAAAMFRRRHIPVFDADAAVHQLQAAGGAATAAIEQLFPGTTSLHGVNRQKLGAAVFGHPQALRRLEALLHPMVKAAQRSWLQRQRRLRAKCVVLDVPLLFEKGGWRGCNVIAVVSAPLHVQRGRVLGRRSMTPEKFAAILAQQLPDADKRARADFILPTGLGKQVTHAAICQMIRQLGSPL